MSGKLDQSLDQILSDRKTTNRGRGRGRRVGNRAAKVTSAAPAGGIQKKTRAGRPAAATTITNGKAPAAGDTKIIVSNLPSDVSEAQIKEYFTKSVAPVKRAMLTYGPNGVSRGVATIIFSKPGSANDALLKLNGMLVDKRPMKIEVVLDAAKATQQGSKALSDRMTQPKSAAPKATTNSTATRGGKVAGGRGGRRGRNAGRPKAKTADELDAEMADYFDPNAPNENAPATNGTAQPVTNGGEDLGMDEIS
ncbi:uncharacterized protein KY384_007917 [Bacidia gigantensis]|uniref:uncharacterized protein n=1 Tax=Bacidia gigantensis TaxID=2732470 RepID=UPI001D04F7BA|nr:uncharacterized protein KY384_007917 [Bacidia gigantensis]KAG8527763.1 hypothetical protein KY384_007917 [Bacidia gigantensis]